VIEARVAEARWGLPSRLFQKDAVKPVSDGRAPDGEAIYPNAMRRALIRRACLATHQELARGDHDHFRLEVHGHSITSFELVLVVFARSPRPFPNFSEPIHNFSDRAKDVRAVRAYIERWIQLTPLAEAEFYDA
jgi:hypothetical protein